jgi:large subunit ribosomal protein L18
VSSGTPPPLLAPQHRSARRGGCLTTAALPIRATSQALRPHHRGTPSASLPRRSNNHIYGQVIDDSKHAIVCSASTMEKELGVNEAGGNCGAATVVGKALGERALKAGVEKVHFDRNGRPYHGRVKALAEAAREAGLSF